MVYHNWCVIVLLCVEGMKGLAGCNVPYITRTTSRSLLSNHKEWGRQPIYDGLRVEAYKEDRSSSSGIKDQQHPLDLLWAVKSFSS